MNESMARDGEGTAVVMGAVVSWESQGGGAHNGEWQRGEQCGPWRRRLEEARTRTSAQPTALLSRSLPLSSVPSAPSRRPRGPRTFPPQLSDASHPIHSTERTERGSLSGRRRPTATDHPSSATIAHTALCTSVLRAADCPGSVLRVGAPASSQACRLLCSVLAYHSPAHSLVAAAVASGAPHIHLHLPLSLTHADTFSPSTFCLRSRAPPLPPLPLSRSSHLRQRWTTTVRVGEVSAWQRCAGLLSSRATTPPPPRPTLLRLRIGRSQEGQAQQKEEIHRTAHTPHKPPPPPSQRSPTPSPPIVTPCALALLPPPPSPLTHTNIPLCDSLAHCSLVLSPLSVPLPPPPPAVPPSMCRRWTSPSWRCCRCCGTSGTSTCPCDWPRQGGAHPLRAQTLPAPPEAEGRRGHRRVPVGQQEAPQGTAAGQGSEPIEQRGRGRRERLHSAHGVEFARRGQDTASIIASAAALLVLTNWVSAVYCRSGATR